MSKKLLAIFLSTSVFFLACGSNSNMAENAGRAMAETACLLFDNSISFEDIPALTEDIIAKYGFESSESIDDYLFEIQGTEELNEVAVAVREHLDATCGAELEANGLTAADLSEAIVLE